MVPVTVQLISMVDSYKEVMMIPRNLVVPTVANLALQIYDTSTVHLAQTININNR